MRSWQSSFDLLFYPDYEDGWDLSRFRDFVNARVARSARLLDVGAGRGASEVLDLRKRAELAVGIDPSPLLLLNRQLHALVMATGQDLPFRSAAFDTAISCDVLEHVPDPSSWFQEVHRVLKPGGQLLLKTPNRYHYAPTIARWSPEWFHGLVHRLRHRLPEDTFTGYYRCNTARLLRQAASRHGFQIDALESREGRPEYLRWNPITYLAGLAWERTVNHVGGLSRLRAVLYACLIKCPGTGA